MNHPPNRDHRLISIWLFTGVVMVLVQILLGSITRLTGSGLSITNWDIVTGALPPMNETQWNEAFDLYKQTPQYREINQGMSISDFRFIFFWEYIHRLWARTMGFVFVLPFLYFLLRKSLNNKLLQRLGIVILIAALAAVFGWVMVKSGLVDRPWVDAYKLTIHLGLGISLFVYLFFTWLSHRGYQRYTISEQGHNRIKLLIGIVVVQLALGGILSGMKAALNYPTWPLMHGEYLPQILLQGHQWNTSNFLMYDKSGFMPALIQFLHRNLAYLITIAGFVFAIKWNRHASDNWQWIGRGLVGIIVVQVLLGILTLLNSYGSIPVLYGVLHQGFAIMLITFLFYIYLITKPLKTL